MLKLIIVFLMVASLSVTVVGQQNNPYLCLGDAEGVSSLKITERSLGKLKSEGVPIDILKALEAIKNREFIEEAVLLDALRAAIGNEQAAKYRSKILAYTSRERSVSLIRHAIKNRLAALDRKHDAREYCVIAELMKRVGDYRAPDYYVKAIDADRKE